MPRKTNIDKINLFYEFARQIINQNPNMSAAAINRIFKQTYGEGLNKSKYLEIVREIKQQPKSLRKYQAGVKGGRPKRLMGIREQLERLYPNIPILPAYPHQFRRIHYVGNFYTTDGKKIFEEGKTIADDNVLSIHELEEAAYEMFSDIYTSFMDIEPSEVVFALEAIRLKE